MDNRKRSRLHPKNIYRTIRKYTPTLTGIGLFVLLIVSVRYFVISLDMYYREGELHLHHHNSQSMLADPSDASGIQPWMTFDYINVVHKLPPSYLKESLNITDSKYPNVRIGQYAKRKGINSSDFISTIKQSISTYYSGK